MKPREKPCGEEGRARSRSSRGRRWGCLVLAVGCLALVGGCKNEEDGCDGSDCSNYTPPWVTYEAWTSGRSYPVVYLSIERDGVYRMDLDRGIPSAEEAACGENCEDGTSGYLCMTGQLDSGQLDAVEALQQEDLSEAYAIDDVSSGPDARDRGVSFGSVDEGTEGFSLVLYSEGSLQPETATLIDTLDGIALDLYARAEYCTEEDRALAEDGEWVFPISE